MSKFVYLIPLFPLVGFLFNFLVGVGLRGRAARGHTEGHGAAGHDVHAAHAKPSPVVGLVACGTVLLSFLTSVYAVMRAQAAPDHTLVERLWTWLPGGLAPWRAGWRPSPSTGPTRWTRSPP